MAALCTFPSIRAAVDATVHMLAVGVSVGRVELLDEISIDVSNQCSNLDLPVSPTLFMEFSGTSAAVEEDSHRASKKSPPPLPHTLSLCISYPENYYCILSVPLRMSIVKLNFSKRW